MDNGEDSEYGIKQRRTRNKQKNGVSCEGVWRKSTGSLTNVARGGKQIPLKHFPQRQTGLIHS